MMMMMMMMMAALLLIMSSTLLVAVSAAGCPDPCNAIDSACAIGQYLPIAARMNLGADEEKVATFCVKVDSFSSLKVTGTAEAVANAPTVDLSLFVGTDETILESFEFVNDSVIECEDKNALARAHAEFLILNITLKDGVLLEAGEMTTPAATGLQDTCDSDDVCIFDAGLPCIKSGDRSFCARCVDEKDTKGDEREPSVFIGFYGTDRRGRPLTSGGRNPITFRQFSAGGLYEKIKSTKLPF
eukprot:NODE_2864_length_1102_cov_26.865147_g2626_i0.p1 GENE.NODE_2864_length_1102_cov_26.865147_g2626_i0~~NODE_2864_length_1102_cov_26.865147_g2626_i0.p1  ORF type:complete len:243 (+),score=48.36 NODE_2864_length_1102_cov_26.865147_g2626_i0:170-898(+)